MKNNKLLLGSLILPILGIIFMIASSEIEIRNSKTFKHPIRGIDPRDLLKGHYITYRFNWDFDKDKTLSFFDKFSKENKNTLSLHREYCLCVSDKLVYPLMCEDKKSQCNDFARGRFRNRSRWNWNTLTATDLRNALLDGRLRFTLGIEKFYVPEDKAKKLESKLAENNGEVEFTINRNHSAVLIDLYLDGKLWSEGL